MKFSFIIPIHNRPDELRDLLKSFLHQSDNEVSYEIIIVDDGSTINLESVIETYTNLLPIRYIKKENTGPGHSRNKGMELAKGEYFIILDSDVILPHGYLRELNLLKKEKQLLAAGGGPDMARKDFSPFIRAVDLAMTSFMTTGGIRGNKKKLSRFVPRSFNMIIRRDVFENTGGFGNMHPGEDPDWIYRLWKKDYPTGFYPRLNVYHKRRSDWKSFFKQVKKFGVARAILNYYYPEYASPVYYFPLLYMIGLVFAILLGINGYYFLLYIYMIYELLIMIEFLWRSKNIYLTLLAWWVFHIQIFAYAYGFIQGLWKIKILKQSPQKAFPGMFFQKNNNV